MTFVRTRGNKPACHAFQEYIDTLALGKRECMKESHGSFKEIVTGKELVARDVAGKRKLRWTARLRSDARYLGFDLALEGLAI